MEAMNRRPLKTRSAPWAGTLARSLAGIGVTPNGVSVAGIFIAVAGGLAFFFAGTHTGSTRAILLVAAAISIQLRLLCNMIDGLIAVECGLKSKTGDLFNEVPDRLEDSAFLIGAGYASMAAYGTTLGWLAALLAVSTAYVRLLGGSLGFPQDFCGPMAKQHRMFFLTLFSLVAAAESLLSERRLILFYGLAFIIAGAAVTFIRRLRRIARALHTR